MSVTQAARHGRGLLLAALVVAFITTTGTRAAPANELELIEPGKLYVALNGDMPGTGLEDDRLVGFDGEVMAWIAKELDLEVVPKMMEWASEIESVKAGRVDVMHGMMAWTKSREKVMRITDPIYYVGVTITQKKGQNWNTIEDLEGSTFGTITGFALIPELKKIEGLDLKLYDTSDAAIRDLLAGRVDAMFADPPLVHWAIKQNPDWDIQQVPLVDVPSDEFPILAGRYGVVFAMNRKSDNLVAAFNQKIAELWQRCSNLEVAEKYGMGDVDMWFTPPAETERIGIDRPEGWRFPTLSDRCME